MALRKPGYDAFLARYTDYTMYYIARKVGGELNRADWQFGQIKYANKFCLGTRVPRHSANVVRSSYV